MTMLIFNKQDTRKIIMYLAKRKGEQGGSKGIKSDDSENLVLAVWQSGNSCCLKIEEY